MGAETAHTAFLQFQDVVTESADETVERYEAILEKYSQQGVHPEVHMVKPIIPSQPNEHYTHLKKSYQNAEVKPDLQRMFSSMRDDDVEHHMYHATPIHGCAAFADAVRLEAEILWAQRNKDATRPSGSRPAASHTV